MTLNTEHIPLEHIPNPGFLAALVTRLNLWELNTEREIDRERERGSQREREKTRDNISKTNPSVYHTEHILNPGLADSGIRNVCSDLRIVSTLIELYPDINM